jgi:hypothetical protein
MLLPGVKYTLAALTFAIGLGVNIDYGQMSQQNSGSWLGSALTVSGAYGHGRIHGGGFGGGHHHGGFRAGYHAGHHEGYHEGYHDGHHDDYDHHHHHDRAAWRALGAAAFLATLPRGCPLVGLYYYCGGVYYQSVVREGSTVYIVVTP